jgi:hypothetical protein
MRETPREPAFPGSAPQSSRPDAGHRHRKERVPEERSSGSHHNSGIILCELKIARKERFVPIVRKK